MAPSRFTKVKIAIGYSLLLAILLFSLVFVHREMETLSASDDQQSLMTDSLLVLLREKDKNTIQMLRVLSEANDSLLSAREIEEIIAEQDSVVTQQRVQHRIITTRDSLITKPKKKGFFKRLAEAFVPSKQDTAVLVNTSLEVATDTILEAYNPTDSLHQKIRMASEQKRAQKKTTIRRRNVQFRRLDTQLTAQIDSLVKEYELNVMQRAQMDAEKEQYVRQRSARIIGGIAVGAVLLSIFFLIIIWRDITRSNRYRRELEEANRRAEELLNAREKLMLAITHDFQLCLNKNELFKWEEIRKRHEDSGFGKTFCDKVHSRMNTSDTSKDLFKNMWKTIVPEMEVLRPGWKEFLKERLDSLYISSGENDYIYQKSEFDFYCPDWQIQEEQLLVYWIYTYFCGAVYDDEIFTKVKMAVVCTLFIHELDVGTYLKNEHHFNLNDQIQICYQFSRELEHSDLNLNKFQELMSENNIFSFENLLKIC